MGISNRDIDGGEAHLLFEVEPGYSQRLLICLFVESTIVYSLSNTITAGRKKLGPENLWDPTRLALREWTNFSSSSAINHRVSLRTGACVDSTRSQDHIG